MSMELVPVETVKVGDVVSGKAVAGVRFTAKRVYLRWASETVEWPYAKGVKVTRAVYEPASAVEARLLGEGYRKQVCAEHGTWIFVASGQPDEPTDGWCEGCIWDGIDDDGE